MNGFLFQATLYLGAAVIAVPLAKRLGLGSVLGYLLAGIVIGPMFGLVGSETTDIQHFAEFGVVMMLFLVGLELEPKALWDMRHRLIGLGGLQVTLTAAIVATVCIMIGLTLTESIAVSLIFSLSSTAIVIQTLNEKKLMNTGGGRSAFSVLLTQDIAVIPMLAFLPLLASPYMREHSDDHGGETLSLIEGLPGWGVTLVTLGAIIAVIVIGHIFANYVFRYIARARLREMFTAVSLFLVVGIAVLMNMVGLSPALGTFLAGVVLANSEFRHELEADIEPFKGLLLGLFFITVGAGINFAILSENFANIVGWTIVMMLAKGLVLYVLAIIFKIKGRDKWLFVLSLAQAGEFGFVLISFTGTLAIIPSDLAQTLLLIVALSMLLTPLLFIVYDQLAKRQKSDTDEHKEDDIDEDGPVIIVGIGRFGQIVNRLAIACGIKTVVIDHKIEAIEQMRTFGVKGYFGDPTRPELLHSAGLMTARVLVIAVDDQKAAIKLVTEARRARPDLFIITRAYDREHTYRLYAAGADDIIRANFDSSLRAGKSVLQQMGWSSYDTDKAADSFFKADRHALEELAKVWDPKIDSRKNKAYIETARAINKELETAFLANIAPLVEENKPD